MLDLDQSSFTIIQSILKKHVPEYDVYVFGSRVTGKAKRYSDIDLLLKGEQEIAWRRLEVLKEIFSESDLPILVDVVDAHTLSQTFLSQISPQSYLIQQAKR